MKTLLLLCLLVLSLDNKTQKANPALLETDRDFADSFSERGVEGWMSFVSENTVLSMWHDSEPVRGRREIREYLAGYFKESGSTVILNAEAARLSPAGNAGYTSGTYEWIIPNPGCRCKNDFKGTYVTGWRLGDDGRWRIKSFTVLEESGTGCGCSHPDTSNPE